MNARQPSPRSLEMLGLESDDPSDNAPSLQLVIPPKELTLKTLENTYFSPHTAINNDTFCIQTPQVPFENLGNSAGISSHEILTASAKEIKPKSISILPSADLSNTNPEQSMANFRSRAASLKPSQFTGNQQKVHGMINLTKHDIPAVKVNNTDAQSTTGTTGTTPKNGPSRLALSVKRIIEVNKKNNIAVKGFSVEEEDDHDNSAGAGRRWKKVMFMMKALSKLKKNQKDTSEIELTRKQLEILYDFGITQDQRPPVSMSREMSKSSPPKLVKNQFNSFGSIKSLTAHKGWSLKTPYLIAKRFLDCINCKKQKILSETALRNKIRKKREKSLREKLKIPFNPSAKFRLGWDIFVLILIVVDMIILPLQISFSVFGDADVYQFAIDSIFALDILLTFHTAFYQNGDLITNHKRIARHYIKTWLWIDFMSAFPFHAIENISSLEVDNATLHKSSFLKLFRVLKLIKVIQAFRFLKLSKIFWKFKVFLGYSQASSFFQLIKLIIVVILVSHWLACIWHLVAIYELDFTNDETWLTARGIDDADAAVRYINSLYWAVTTMLTVGYGDITPVSIPELWCSVFSMFFACGVFAYSLNTIGSIISNLSRSKGKVSWKIYAINKFMQKKNMRKEIQERVRGYMEHLLEEENTRKHDQDEFLSLMPDHLKRDILIDLNGRFLTENIIFNTSFSLYFLKDLATKLQERNLGPGESIYLTGGYFGEVAFFSDKKRTVSARSANYSQVFFLEKKAFLEALENNPTEKERYYQIRDKINLYDDYSPLRVKCFACDKDNHLVQNCSQIQYIPNPQQIIAITRKEDLLFRSTFARPQRRRFNALKNLDEINNKTDKFRESTFIFPLQGQLSRNSSLVYKLEMKRKFSQGEFSVASEDSSLVEEDQEIKVVDELKPELLPQIDEEPIIQESSLEHLTFERTRIVKFAEKFHSDAPETKKKKDKFVFEKLKIFSKYFVHNNADVIISRINRLNHLKQMASNQHGKERRHSTNEISLSNNLAGKNQKSASSLSILPGLFKKVRLSQESIKIS